ncbi:hypothetical protein BYT27DRAFT_7264700 [Phlegmacium glaucopus]|nr:hypothetical protein BYT27DRAFT_7264700 [Phlegmacium glaucopus]
MAPAKIYSSTPPKPQDSLISVHAVDSTTSASSYVSSKHTRTTADLQGAVVEFLIPHLGDKALIRPATWGRRNQFLYSQGLLNPGLLPKDAGRYTAIAPALPKSDSFVANFPSLAAFQPDNLTTIFSPGVDSDLALLKQQFAELLAATKQNFGKIEKMEEEVVQLKKKTERLEEENGQLKAKIGRLEEGNDQLKGENGRFKTRISALEEEVDGYTVIALNAPGEILAWLTVFLFVISSARLARLAQLPEAMNNAGIYYQSFLWRQQLFSLQDEAQRIQYTTQIVAGLDVPTEVIEELANPSSELRIAADRCMSTLSQHLTFASLASIGT